MAILSDLSLSSGERDAFDKQKTAKLALLPRAVEAGHAASGSPLLGLPLEILVDIVDLIADDHATLSTLALVNSDFRQLARSYQFADVCFDYDRLESNQLLRRLLEDTPITLGSTNVPSRARRSQSVGPCIRRVTVRPRSGKLIDRHPDVHDRHLGDTTRTSPDKQCDQFQADAVSEYITTFRDPVLAVPKAAMPNLEALSWHGGMCLEVAPLLRAITHLPMRHLEISGIQIVEPIPLEQLMAPPVALSLESLSLGATVCTYAGYPARAEDTHDWESRTSSPFITALLQSCSTTLKSLRLGYMCFHKMKAFSFGPERILFPRLRYLSVPYFETSFDGTTWSSLFAKTPRLTLIHFPKPGFPTGLIQLSTFPRP